jgi:hypothetical protein
MGVSVNDNSVVIEIKKIKNCWQYKIFVIQCI